MVRKVSQPACAAQEALKGQSRAGGVLLVPLSLVILAPRGKGRTGSGGAAGTLYNFALISTFSVAAAPRKSVTSCHPSVPGASLTRDSSDAA